MSDFDIVSSCVDRLIAKDYDGAIDYLADDIRLDTGMMGVKEGKGTVRPVFQMILNLAGTPTPVEEDDGALFTTIRTPMGRARVVFSVVDNKVKEIVIRKS